MAVLTFGEYRPDLSDLNRPYTASIRNVLPQADGYGPFKDLDPFTDAAPAPCRGLFFAQRADGTVAIFFGTATKLYLLNNTTLTWTDVSQGAGTYSTLNPGANWSFAQFNNFVIATQANDDVQVFELVAGTAFADLAGSPPRSAYVTVVNRFVVLSGIASATNRVHWSALNDVTNWSTLESDSQDLPDGGPVQGVTGGEYGIIVQRSAVRRMVFTPGSAEIFGINRVAKEIGTEFPGSIVEANGIVYFLSQKGFVRIDASGAIVPIGEERFDRTFLREFDPDQPQLIQGATDPRSNLIVWSYKLKDASDSTIFNKLLAFDYIQNKAAPIFFDGQFIVSLARPGITLEGLDLIGSVAISNAVSNGGLIRLTVASSAGMTTGDIKNIFDVGGVPNAVGQWTITVINGTTIDLQGSTFAGSYTSGGYVAGSVDAMGISLDSFAVSGLVQFAGVSSSNQAGTFSGDSLEAVLETAEQTGVINRTWFRGFYPMTDAITAWVSVLKRASLKDPGGYTNEAACNVDGYCPLLLSARYSRLKLRIPAATVWTFATGIEPDYDDDGVG